MSSIFQPKRKELANVRVMSTDEYMKNRMNVKLVGSVSRLFTSFITTQRNKKTGSCSFIEDTAVLTKKTKSSLVRFFMDNRNQQKKVAYLVVPREKVPRKEKKK